MNSQIRIKIEPWEDLNELELVFVVYASEIGIYNLDQAKKELEKLQLQSFTPELFLAFNLSTDCPTDKIMYKLDRDYPEHFLNKK